MTHSAQAAAFGAGVALVLACASTPGELAGTRNPPSGCALGVSGPTLNPGDALRHAQRDALQNLASGTLGVQIDSELYDAGSRSGEITSQLTEGLIEKSRIAAMWSEELPGVERDHRMREVYAVACDPDASSSPLPPPDYPNWLLNIPLDAATTCAPAVGGPTRDPERQLPVTLIDGQRALARALEARVYRHISDDGRSLARVTSEMHISDRALARAQSVEKLTVTWSDPDGRGPLGVEGVLYGLVCVTH